MIPFAALFDRRHRPLGNAVEALGRALGIRLEAPEQLARLSGESFCLLSESGLELRGTAGGQVLPIAGEADKPEALASRLDLRALGTAGDALFAAQLPSFDPGCFVTLPGSFGLAIFDPQAHELHLACDALGGRPLYYFEANGVVAVSNRADVLLRWPGVTWRLDAEQLSRFCALEIPAEGKSYFEALREVPRGTVVSVSSKKLSCQRFWDPRAISRASFGSDSEASKAFLDRLDTAVSDLVDDPPSLGVMLSGGLDSSSLAMLAARRAKSTGHRVGACSWVFDELEACDERGRIDSMLELEDFETIRVNGDGKWPLANREDYSILPQTPEENPYRSLKTSLYRRAATAGRRLLLNGGPADVLHRGSSLYLRDLVLDRRLGTAWRSFKRQVELSGWRIALGAAARIARPQGRRFGPKPLPVWLTPEAGRRLGESASSKIGRAGARDVIDYLGVESRSLAVERLRARREGVEVVSPYWTLEFVEFMLGLPAHLVYRPGMTKFIAREAMRGIVPEPIRLRQTPTLLDPLFDRGLFDREQMVVQDLLFGGEPIWSRLVDRDFIAAVGPGSKPAHKVVFWRCLSLELWRRKHGWELDSG